MKTLAISVLSYLPLIRLCVCPRSVCEIVCPRQIGLWKLPITLEPWGIFDKILHTHWYWQDSKCHFSSVESLPRSEFRKNWNWPYLLKYMDYFDEITRTHLYGQDVAQGIANIIFYWSGLCWGPYLYPRHSKHEGVYSFLLFVNVCVCVCVCVWTFISSKISQELLNLGF